MRLLLETKIQIIDTSQDEIVERFFFMSFIRAFEILMTHILGQLDKHQTTIEFKTAEFDRRELMMKEYDSKLIFASKQNAIRIPKSLWLSPSPLSDPAAYQLNLRACKQIKSELDARGNIKLMVKKILSHHFDNLILDEAADPQSPSLSSICERLHMTERTLIRKLKLQSTSYKQLLEECRFSQAKNLLENARYTIAEISYRLGYKEPANFCRAFKKWSGMSPTNYRRNPPST